MALISHNKGKHPKLFPCEKCEYKAKRKEHLKNHNERIHANMQRSKNFMSSSCNAKYYSKSSLEIHIETNHLQVRYPCDICDHIATQKINLQKHIQAKHERDQRPEYKCSDCNYKSIHKSSITFHKKIKHTENPTYHNCDKCEYKSKFKSSLSNHEKLKHTENPSFHSCSTCSYKTIFKRDLNRHELTHLEPT